MKIKNKQENKMSQNNETPSTQDPQHPQLELPTNFFEDYWQKKPCLLKQATSWRPKITAEELAGIACEEDAEARIIFDQQKEGAEGWQLEQGPFNEKAF